jgi:hypothetical protein
MLLLLLLLLLLLPLLLPLLLLLLLLPLLLQTSLLDCLNIFQTKKTHMVRNTALLKPFIYKNAHFTKTGLGQT